MTRFACEGQRNFRGVEGGKAKVNFLQKSQGGERKKGGKS